MTKIALTIAGSDSCGGAGIQADLKTFSSLRVHGLNAVTSVVSESPHSVDSIFIIPAEEVAKQIHSLVPHYPFTAIKTGLLCNAEIVEAVAKALSKPELAHIPLIIDPVITASTGDSLTAHSITEGYKKHLFSRAHLITPNLIEAQIILGEELDTVSKMQAGAQKIAELYNTSCLIKGGHASFTDQSVDLLYTNGKLISFALPWIDIPSAHGSGCTLSAAITANVAKGQLLPTAVGNAKSWLHKAITNSLIWSQNQSTTYCINQAGI
ncbi:bifunctional hydroxymethylpyrimidine kinase/phosphomethylpyrimidine kinase [Akkermansiaceae bacterium]|nr:bifunctional hydroxymethylpyrimidine kinase/phosphomethylpyrimidine kinase [Akkermansiaceae bacterium]